jgi:hypothetical protein
MLGPKGCSEQAGNDRSAPLRGNTFAVPLRVPVPFEAVTVTAEPFSLLLIAPEGGLGSSYRGDESIDLCCPKE